MDRSSYYTVAHQNEFTLNWKAFYDKTEEMTTEARKSLRNRPDLPYTSDLNEPKQRLDLYFPKSDSDGRSQVFIFLHGGGFREGDKSDYGYVALPLSEHNVITVVPNYRWAPKFQYPSQVNDVEDALTWVYLNISEFGGDPNQIYIGGHSAGAILSSLVSLKKGWAKQKIGTSKNIVKGCVPISGVYDLRERMPYVEIFAPETDMRIEASPSLNMSDEPPNCLIVAGSKEPQSVKSSNDLAEKLAEKGGRAKVLVLENMDHCDTALTLRDSEGALFKEIMELMEHD